MPELSDRELLSALRSSVLSGEPAPVGGADALLRVIKAMSDSSSPLSGAMRLTDVLEEIDAAMDVAKYQANDRVQNTLRVHGWVSRDNGAGLLWAHQDVIGICGLQEAVDIQLAWDARPPIYVQP